MRLKVTDDSGFIGIMDPDAYTGFVDEDWTFDQLLSHFTEQMRQATLIIWATGGDDDWPVDLELGDPVAGGIAGPLRCTAGRLLLTSYDSLTMAAQFADVVLPEPHERDLLCDVPPGDYACSVARMPDDGFKVRLTPADPMPSSWDAPGWYAS